MNGEGEKWVEEGDQWENVDSSEETFFLDPDGRVPFAGEVSFDFRSAPEALASSLSKPGVLDRVHADCQVVFSARAKKLAYSTGKTFWVQADAQPRNSLESLALAIFEAHTANARFNRKTSGAEWWTQVIEGEDDIGWHWDKDYGMEARGMNVHPCLATVTYLSDLGGPTVILEKRGPMACQDVEGVSGGATRAWISAPRVGKHICFDGRYLHAAPADLAPILRPGSRSPARDAGADASADAGANASADASVDASADAGSNAFDENIAGISDGSIGEGGIGAVARVKKRQRDGEAKLHSYPDGSHGINKAISNSSGGSSSSNNTSNGTGNGISTSNTSDTGSNKRVTFLVNVWLNHTPKTACPLSAEKAAALGSYQLAEEFSATAVDELFIHPRVLQVRMAKEAFPELGTGDQAIARATTPEAGRKRCYLETGAETGDDPGRCVGQGSRVGERGQSEEVADAVGMRWEFGEVGDEAGGRVHLRHEVFMPLPVGLAKPGCVGGRGSEAVVAGGGSLCLEYVGGAKPRVSGVGGWGSVGGDDDDDEDEEDDDEDEEDDDEGEEDDNGGEDDDDEEDDDEGDNGDDDDDDDVGVGGE